MRIIVIGAGNAGKHLADSLSKEQHDIVMIDRDEEALNSIQGNLDVQTMVGDGSNPHVLEAAGIRKTDLIVAVTSRDEVNILACSLANLVNVPTKVARIINNEFYKPGTDYDLHRLGIDIVVSENEECAEEILTILKLPGTLEAVNLYEGTIHAVGFKVHMDSPMVFQNLKDLPIPNLLQRIRLIGMMRGEELIIPTGATQFMIGDDVYVAGQDDDLNEFLEWANPEYARFEKVVIAGGGDLGLHLARKLEETGVRTVLIEHDEERADYCAEQLNHTLVLRGDSLSGDILSNVDIVKNTAFVATTGDDETNIMICLLGEKAGATFTIAQVAKPDYVPIISSLSLLDRAVSSHAAMINSILHNVRGKHVHAATALQKLMGELLEIEVPPNSPWAGKKVRNLNLPEGILIALIIRDEESIIVTGDVEFAIGDHLFLFLKPGLQKKVLSLLKG